MSSRFNWDSNLANSSYQNVADRSPSLGVPPTLYSPDGKLLLLSSIDADARVDDSTELKSRLERLTHTFKNYYESQDFKRAGRAYVDFFEVCSLLTQIDPDSEQYVFPIDLLTKKGVLK